MDIVPILTPITSIDASIGKTVYFKYTGSNMAIANELRIKRVDTDSYVYKFTYESLDKLHNIPPNILSNGVVYEADIRLKLQDGTYTNYSSKITFKALTTPVLDIVSIDGQGFVYNSDVTFVASYSQIEDEKVKSFRWTLYDSMEIQIMSFPIKTYIDYITQDITGLEKGKTYYIECKIETVNGVTHKIREKFSPLYIVPTADGKLDCAVNDKNGFATVVGLLDSVVGNGVRAIDSESKTLVDWDDYERDLNNNIIINSSNRVDYEDISIVNDFVASFIVRPLGDYTIAELHSSENNIAFIIQKEGKFVKCKVLENNTTLLGESRSQELTFINNQNVEVVVKLKNDDLTVTLKGV